jgi:hypothetical protein
MLWMILLDAWRSEHRFTAATEEVQLSVNKIEYLDCIISGCKIGINSDRIQALLEAPTPTNSSEARGFLGGLFMLKRFL